MINKILENPTGEKVTLTVIRLSTTYFTNSNGEYIMQKKVRRLKRKSKGFDFLEEDASAVGTPLDMINNLHEVKDGTYEVKMTNVLRDYETGHIEEWEYKLIPYE